MAPTLNLFGLSLQTYLLVLLLAVEVGLWLLAREAERLGIDGDHVHNAGLYALLATVLGARLAYVLGHWSAYRDALLSAFSLTLTALAWPEGALIGGIVALVLWRHYHLPAGATLDALAPALTLSLALERLAAFFGGRGLGEPTDLPWGIHLLGQVRHPVQLYETAALLSILGILWWQRKRRPYPGHSFALSVILYAGSRLFFEAFRVRTPLTANGVRVVQVVALVTMLGATWTLYRHRFTPAEHTSVDRQENPA